MRLQKRPYLIIPKLIIQPTWGGDYILNLKGWKNKNYLKGKKIGQSYELFSGTKILLKINDSRDKNFLGELGYPEKPTILNKTNYYKNKDFINLDQATSFYKKIPLIKINQSTGNSFQIHLKNNHGRWKPKMESCYYLEDGVVTFGIKKNINLLEYKKTCLTIQKKMNELSLMVKKKKITIQKAKEIAQYFVKKFNPWQYINIHAVKKYEIGPGALGIQHSWEEDKRFPQGLINYEIQQNIMDNVSTIRCFDKGKIKDDGSVREIHIADYFKYLDTNPDRNDLKKMTPKRIDNHLLATNYYSLDIFEIDKEITDKTNGSFSHLYVRDGQVIVKANDGLVFLSKGHSCFISENVIDYKLIPESGKAVVLKTFV